MVGVIELQHTLLKFPRKESYFLLIPCRLQNGGFVSLDNMKQSCFLFLEKIMFQVGKGCEAQVQAVFPTGHGVKG